MSEAPVLFDREGPWGIITLNRPNVLNALSLDMVTALRARLMEWERQPSVRAVLIKGAGDRAFCAGGDIRWLHDAAREDPAIAMAFFREEYRNNAAIYHFPKPYVALIDGVVMGGGVGVSIHGDFRVAGDRTLFAMPETGIGLFPDIGGGHFMPRLHDGLGLYYALTGARAKAADCMAAGLATHYTSTDKMRLLEDALMCAPLGAHAHADIEAVLDAHAEDPGHAPINDVRPVIKAHFEAPESYEALIAALEAYGGDAAGDILDVLARQSPTSLKLTFEQMKRGKAADFDHVMQMEFRIMHRLMRSPDFFEGVRAQIIDKDRNPTWRPPHWNSVSDADIAAYFDNLGEEELVLP